MFCAALASAGWIRAGSGTGPVVAVMAAGTAAYTLALEGIRTAMGGATPLEVVEVTQKAQTDGLPRLLLAKRPRLIIAIGAEAAAAVVACPGAMPVITTMILVSDTEKGDAGRTHPAGMVSSVCLDMPVSAVCHKWKQLIPGKTRMAIIHNPGKSGPSAATLESQAAAADFSARTLPCTRPEELVPAFLSLKNTVDFVWCMPDSTLYNSATVKPLLMASLGQRLPIIGFSESFVRAGAVMGVYPDFGDVGVQTAEAAHKFLNGEAPQSVQGPRVICTAFNHRVARLLGLRYEAPPEDDKRMLVLK